jgi:hypothetical protein
MLKTVYLLHQLNVKQEMCCSVKKLRVPEPGASDVSCKAFSGQSGFYPFGIRFNTSTFPV